MKVIIAGSGDQGQLGRELMREGFEAALAVAKDIASLKIRLEEGPDILLAELDGDKDLPAHEVFAAVQSAKRSLPVIVISRAADPRVPAHYVGRGAEGYVMHDRMARLGSEVRRAVNRAQQSAAKTQLESQLRQAELTRRSILDRSKDVIWSFSPVENRITYVSRAAESVYGHTPEEFMQRTEVWMEVVQEEDRGNLVVATQQAVAHGYGEAKFRVNRPDGRPCHCLYRVWSVTDETGKLVRLDGMTIDITQGVELENERQAKVALQQEAAQLKQVLDFKTQFTNIVIHELNNPLTTMRLYMELLKRDASLSPQQRTSILAVSRGVAKLDMLLGDLLDAVRAQSGTLAIKRIEADLPQLVRTALEEARLQAEAAGVTLRLEVPDSLVAQVDPRRMSQLLANLVNNAIKFTPRGGLIVLKLTGSPEHFELSVVDTGSGISANDKPRLFEAFSKLMGPQSAHSGTGLGLFICRSIAEGHGGKIWCTSEGPGKGCTFAVSIPNQAAETPTVK